jgi:hypothetical protein
MYDTLCQKMINKPQKTIRFSMTGHPSPYCSNMKANYIEQRLRQNEYKKLNLNICTMPSPHLFTYPLRSAGTSLNSFSCADQVVCVFCFGWCWCWLRMSVVQEISLAGSLPEQKAWTFTFQRKMWQNIFQQEILLKWQSWTFTPKCLMKITVPLHS